MIYVGTNKIGKFGLTTPIVEPAVERDVNFYDYDGTLLYSYTNEDALALTNLPALPDRTSENLTAEGWNWTLADIKNQINQVGGIVDIAPIYYTLDDNTHIFYEASINQYELSITLTPSASNDVTIDWGDGNTSIIEEATQTTVTHSYTVSGITQFDVSISSANTYIFPTYLCGSTTLNSNTYIHKIHFSRKVSRISSVCDYMYNLNYVTIPNETTVGAYSFRYCYNLILLPLPYTLMTVPTQIAANAYGAHVVMSGAVTYLVNHTFRYAYGMKLNTIPYKVTYLGTQTKDSHQTQYIFLGTNINTLYGQVFKCAAKTVVQINRESPPTILTNTLTGNIREIRVPSSAVDTYKAATNWSNYADIIVAIPE